MAYNCDFATISLRKYDTYKEISLLRNSKLMAKWVST